MKNFRRFLCRNNTNDEVYFCFCNQIFRRKAIFMFLGIRFVQVTTIDTVQNNSNLAPALHLNTASHGSFYGFEDTTVSFSFSFVCQVNR